MMYDMNETTIREMNEEMAELIADMNTIRDEVLGVNLTEYMEAEMTASVGR